MASETERMAVTRVFDAPREVVWKAWTDPKYAMQWWGPKGITTPTYEMDFRVGGKFLICMKSPDGQELWNGGEYHEIVPHEKIVLSMYFSDSKGNKVQPEHYGMEHEAIDGAHDMVLFEDLGNGQTRLTFIGNETMEEAVKSGQAEGWNQILEKFGAVVAELAQAKAEYSQASRTSNPNQILDTPVYLYQWKTTPGPPAGHRRLWTSHTEVRI